MDPSDPVEQMTTCEACGLLDTTETAAEHAARTGHPAIMVTRSAVLKDDVSLDELKRRYAEAQRVELDAWQRSERAQAEWWKRQDNDDFGSLGQRAGDALRAWASANRAARSAADTMLARARSDARERGWNLD